MKVKSLVGEGEEGGIIRPPPAQRLARAVNVPLPQVEIPFPNDTVGVHVNKSLRGVVRGLKAWTRYNVLVVGYNSAGLGDPGILSITTLDSSKCTLLSTCRIKPVQ